MVRFCRTVIGVALSTAGAFAIKDSNQYGWNRVRRCDDDYGYLPAANPNNPFDVLGEVCGPCEGLGGPLGPTPEDGFQASYWDPPQCSIINHPGDIPEPPRPVWRSEYTADSYTSSLYASTQGSFETEPVRRRAQAEDGDDLFGDVFRSASYNFVLNRDFLLSADFEFIRDASEGPNDPVVFPEELEGGSDFYHYMAPPIEGNTFSNMFFVEMDTPVEGTRIPETCLCTFSELSPWLNDLLLSAADITSIESDYETRYVGREMLDIEYYGPNLTTVPMIVDHWVKGAHHFWATTDTVEVVRMTAGDLGHTTTFTNYRDLEDSARERILDGPLGSGLCGTTEWPDIGCGPDPEEAEASQARLPADADATSRAENWFPRAEYRGDNFEDMTSVLNIHLTTLLAGSVGHKECSEFTIDELDDVMRLINAARDPQLQSIYEGCNDPRSLDSTMPAGTTAQHLEDRFMAEKALIAAAQDLEGMMRDGKCHETVMWFIHHLSTEAQLEVAGLLYLPLLPSLRHAMNGHAVSTASGAIETGYIRSIQCTDCHISLVDDVEVQLDDASNKLGGGGILGIAMAGAFTALVVGVAARRIAKAHHASGVAQHSGRLIATAPSPRFKAGLNISPGRYESLGDEGIASV